MTVDDKHQCVCQVHLLWPWGAAKAALWRLAESGRLTKGWGCLAGGGSLATKCWCLPECGKALGRCCGTGGAAGLRPGGRRPLRGLLLAAPRGAARCGGGRAAAAGGGGAAKVAEGVCGVLLRRHAAVPAGRRWLLRAAWAGPELRGRTAAKLRWAAAELGWTTSKLGRAPERRRAAELRRRATAKLRGTPAKLGRAAPKLRRALATLGRLRRRRRTVKQIRQQVLRAGLWGGRRGGRLWGCSWRRCKPTLE